MLISGRYYNFELYMIKVKDSPKTQAEGRDTFDDDPFVPFIGLAS